MPDLEGMDAAVAALLDAGRVVVCGHVNPDGDSMGSVLGATLALRKRGIDAVPTLAEDRPGPATYAFLPGFAEFASVAGLEAPDVFLALDCPSFERLGVAEPLARAARRLVVIDHHPDCGRFGDISVVDAGAASVGSLIWGALPAFGVTPDPDIASCLYTALMTDTGRFSYSNTTPLALRDAAAMIEAGADPSALYRKVYESRSAASLALLGRTLSRVTLANGGRVVYAWITDEDLAETGAAPEETENLVDAVRQTGRVDAAAFFKASPDGVKVSLRAKCPGLDVGAVARTFGGGGHAAAAGASIQAPLEDAIAQVLALLPGAA